MHAGSGKDQAGNRGTLVNALLHRFNGLSQIGGELRPGIVHRLDKETSGLMIVAKSDKAHRKLAEQFSRREVKKTYIALVHGWMKTSKGTVNAAISRDLVRRARMTTRRTSTSRPGRDAVTHWLVTRQIEGEYGKFSLLEIKIETGRTHQIRVHLSSVGHPIGGRYTLRRAGEAFELRRYRIRTGISGKELSARFRDTISSIQSVTGRFRSSSRYRLS